MINSSGAILAEHNITAIHYAFRHNYNHSDDIILLTDDTTLIFHAK
jgi:hypothetical protein